VSPQDPVLGHEIQEALAAHQWQRAAELLERWCEINPDHAPGWSTRAGCLARLGRTAEALACAREALRLVPGDERVAQLAAILELRLAGAAPPAAEPALPPAVEAPESRPATLGMLRDDEVEAPGTLVDSRTADRRHRGAAEQPVGPAVSAPTRWQGGTLIEGAGRCAAGRAAGWATSTSSSTATSP
jgi:tetratricopeptide (TPR) repeat protein